MVILVGRDRRVGERVIRQSNEFEYRPAFKRRDMKEFMTEDEQV